MRAHIKLNAKELLGYFEGITIIPVTSENNITALELKQGGRILHIAVAGAYSSNLSCSKVQDGIFEERYTLKTPNGELRFESEDDAEDAKRALGLDVVVFKERVRVD